MLIKDRLKITSERKYTDEGFLIVPARISRTGIQQYLAVEMGLTDKEPSELVSIYRPEEEVFSDESLSSFANKTVTDDHPPELVNAGNSKVYSVGFSGPEVNRDGMFAKTIIHVTDAEAIRKIESGKVELSNGYTADIEWTPGVTPDGETYDAIQRNIKGNHIAIVERGRAGPSCRVADNLPDDKDETNMLITIDGVDYEVSDQAAQAIGKVQARLKDAEEETKKKEDEMEEQKEESKKTEDSLKAQLDDAKSKVVTTAQIDSMVADRAKFIDSVLKVAPEYTGWEGKDESTIKSEVVALKCDGVVTDSVSADYINARFDILVEDSAKSNTLNDEFKQQVNDDNKKVEDSRPADVIAREKFQKETRDAWKGGAE